MNTHTAQRGASAVRASIGAVSKIFNAIFFSTLTLLKERIERMNLVVLIVGPVDYVESQIFLAHQYFSSHRSHLF
jgi:hypothetical protein